MKTLGIANKIRLLDYGHVTPEMTAKAHRWLDYHGLIFAPISEEEREAIFKECGIKASEMALAIQPTKRTNLGNMLQIKSVGMAAMQVGVRLWDDSRRPDDPTDNFMACLAIALQSIADCIYSGE